MRSQRTGAHLLNVPRSRAAFPHFLAFFLIFFSAALPDASAQWRMSPPAASSVPPRARQRPAPVALPFVNLDQVFAKWNFVREPTRVPGIARWKNASSQIESESGKTFITIHGVRIWIGSPISETRGIFYMRRADYENTLLPLVAPTLAGGRPPRRVTHVLLDPGHGGKDAGGQSIAKHLHEKNLTLDVARRLKFILERAGLRVSMTRTTDVFVPLSERPAMAARVGADLFVSIHFNALSASPSAAGIETYALAPAGQYATNDSRRATSGNNLNAREIGHAFNTWNTLLSYQIQSNLIRKTPAIDRGLRRARFVVLKDAPVPATLVECGFLSNPNEATKINTGAHREKIAQGIANGILRYKTITDAIAPPHHPAPNKPHPQFRR
ncbi:MAG: N-acetylmuramoyl-L-alanine amidase [Puniceicoccales bacterium]|jgi:N-acetylmuramoyl-L-alanine amidase|nr:N-acetylmuramoyl-L-alanine amidase [Puniceicoccales bacterium]